MNDIVKIGDITVKNKVFLAPMAGVTDLPFRLLCQENGCGLTYTEMVSGKGILYNNENTKFLLQMGDNEQPVAAQLFGSDPMVLASAVKMIEGLPIDIIDINMGCPVPKIFNNGEGSALMKNPKLVGEIVKKVANATNKPVTVKIRTGITKDSINAVEIAKIAEENGAKAVTVHGRYREQYYSNDADWETIRRVKNAVNIPVIGNGDVRTPENAKALFEETGVDAIMLGRAAMGDPWIFQRILTFLKKGVILPAPSWEEKRETAIRHGKMMVEYKGEFVGVREMRSHLGWYTKGLKDSSKFRASINKIESFAEIEELLRSFT